MHHSFRPPLFDLKSQKLVDYQAILRFLGFEIGQGWSEVYNGEIISAPFLINCEEFE